MNFDITITGDSFGSIISEYLITKNFNVSVARIKPEITILKDIPLLIPTAIFKYLSIPFKLVENNFTTFTNIDLYLFNIKKTLSSKKRIFISTNLEKLKKFLISIIPENKAAKKFQNQIKEIFFSNNGITIKLSNNKIVNTLYLIVGDDFWGSSWNILNFKPSHTGGWVIKTPILKSFNSKPFIAFGYSPKSIVISNQQNLIFAKHIQKEYTMDDLIKNFLLNNKTIDNITIEDWNKYVLPFTTNLPSPPKEILKHKVFFITEYLGLMNYFIPDFTYLTSTLSSELIPQLDSKIKSLDKSIPILEKVINYNKIFKKVKDFIDSFPFIFFNNQEKDQILADLFIGQIDPIQLDRNMKQIFDKYDPNLEIVLSQEALNYNE